MFTGIIEEVGKVVSISRKGTGKNLRVHAESFRPDIGESIAVNGACLSVSQVAGKTFELFLSPETSRRSNLSQLTPGKKVNLERALKLGDRIGGHLVQGHVDGISRVIKYKRDGESVLLLIAPPREFLSCLIPKGSVALDGVSLTITEIKGNYFSIAIIPHTLGNTTLRECKVGSYLNIEVDIIGKYLKCQNSVL